MVSRDRFTLKLMVLLMTSFCFWGTDLCSERAPSCIHTVFYQGLSLLRDDALGGFTGSVRIKNDGFAKDIVLFSGD